MEWDIEDCSKRYISKIKCEREMNKCGNHQNYASSLVLIHLYSILSDSTDFVLCYYTNNIVFLFQFCQQLQFDSLYDVSGPSLRSPMLAPLSWALGLLSSATQLSRRLRMSLNHSCFSSDHSATQELALNDECQSLQGLAGILWLQNDPHDKRYILHNHSLSGCNIDFHIRKQYTLWL